MTDEESLPEDVVEALEGLAEWFPGEDNPNLVLQYQSTIVSTITDLQRKLRESEHLASKQYQMYEKSNHRFNQADYRRTRWRNKAIESGRRAEALVKECAKLGVYARDMEDQRDGAVAALESCQAYQYSDEGHGLNHEDAIESAKGSQK